MKKALCLILSVCLLLGTALPASASIFEPRQLFRFLPSDIEKITISNTVTGRVAHIDDREAIEEVVTCLVDFRYTQTVQHVGDFDIGYEHTLELKYVDGFMEDPIELYYFDDWSIRLEDKSYFGDEGCFDLLLSKVAGEAEVLFDDVTSNDEFYSAVKFVIEKGIFVGASAAKFLPSAPMTRAMAVTTLHRLAGKPAGAEAGFADVPEGAYYAPAVNWATENGIVSGTTEKTFSPNRKVTREQFAVILYRYAQMDIGAASPGEVETWFSDAAKISPYAREAAEWSLRAGIMDYKDKAERTMEPGAEVSRAEAAVMYKNLWEYLDSANDYVG